MLGKILLVATLVAISWCATLERVKRHDAEEGLVRQKRHDEDETQNLDDVNPAMILDDNCDNGQENLTMDWDQNPDIYTCKRPNTIPLNSNPPIYYCQDETFEPVHVCTFEHVPANADQLPISGAHRPVWPQYGEYRYIPPQRYLHGLEHGGIGLFYHPCADQGDLDILRKTLNGCLWRHIISATDNLSEDYPFALLSWGCSLKLGRADVDLAIAFIKEHALQSDEFAVFFDGFFNQTLFKHADFVTDKKDSVICPGSPPSELQTDSILLAARAIGIQKRHGGDHGANPSGDAIPDGSLVAEGVACDGCQDDLSNHMETHAKYMEEKMELKCDTCDEDMHQHFELHKQFMKDHMQIVCDGCDDDWANNLRMHAEYRQLHSDDGCMGCDDDLAFRKDAHMAYMKNNLVFECVGCYDNMQSHLQQHLDYIRSHTELVCDGCKENMQMHIDTHIDFMKDHMHYGNCSGDGSCNGMMQHGKMHHGDMHGGDMKNGDMKSNMT